MKILFDHGQPFSLVHGGYQALIEQTKAGLESIGVEIEWMKWWDENARGDLIHCFAPVNPPYLSQAARKGIPTVLTSLLDVVANEPEAVFLRRKLTYGLAARLPGIRSFFLQSPMMAGRFAAHNIVTLPSHARALHELYGVPAEKISAVPLALPDSFRGVAPSDRSGAHLISVATISERKRNVELAQRAKRAQVPVLFVGRPYSLTDPYWKSFERLIDGQYVLYDGECRGDAQLVERLQKARGFVLLSRVESWSFASDEAAACGLPLLLPWANWARDRFGDQARFWDRKGEDQEAALRRFFEECPARPAPAVSFCSWPEVAVRLRAIYQNLIDSGRDHPAP